MQQTVQRPACLPARPPACLPACLPTGDLAHEREHQRNLLSLWRCTLEEIELLEHNPNKFIEQHGRPYGF